MNKPATPLPWVHRASPDNRPSRTIYQQDSIGKPTMIPVADCFIDSPYIVHACNAYPRLIQALKDAIAQPLDWHPEHARALLRELGEAE